MKREATEGLKTEKAPTVSSGAFVRSVSSRLSVHARPRRPAGASRHQGPDSNARTERKHRRQHMCSCVEGQAIPHRRANLCAQVVAEKTRRCFPEDVSRVLDDVQEAMAQDGQGPGLAGWKQPGTCELFVSFWREIQPEQVTELAKTQEMT